MALVVSLLLDIHKGCFRVFLSSLFVVLCFGNNNRPDKRQSFHNDHATPSPSEVGDAEETILGFLLVGIGEYICLICRD